MRDSGLSKGQGRQDSNLQPPVLETSDFPFRYAGLRGGGQQSGQLSPAKRRAETAEAVSACAACEELLRQPERHEAACRDAAEKRIALLPRTDEHHEQRLVARGRELLAPGHGQRCPAVLARRLLRRDDELVVRGRRHVDERTRDVPTVARRNVEANDDARRGARDWARRCLQPVDEQPRRRRQLVDAERDPRRRDIR